MKYELRLFSEWWNVSLFSSMFMLITHNGLNLMQKFFWIPSTGRSKYVFFNQAQNGCTIG